MLAGWCCQSPGCRTRDELEVHHRSYERLGAELDEDLRVFCPAHHHHLHDRYEQLKRLHWRAFATSSNSGPFDDFANFVETVKVRFARARIAIDPHELQELLARRRCATCSSARRRRCRGACASMTPRSSTSARGEGDPRRTPDFRGAVDDGGGAVVRPARGPRGCARGCSASALEMGNRVVA